MNAANTLRADVPSCSTCPHTLALTLMNLELTSRPLRFCCCRAFWVSEIGQPSSAVEFGVSGRDLAFAVDVEDIDTLDLLIVVAGTVDRDPAPADLVAAVEGIEGLEVEWGLRPGSSNES